MKLKRQKSKITDFRIEIVNDFIHKYNSSETIIYNGEKLKKIKNIKLDLSTNSKNGKTKIKFGFNSTEKCIESIIFSTDCSSYDDFIRINRSIVCGLGYNLYDASTFIATQVWDFGDYVLKYDCENGFKGKVSKIN